MDGECSVEAIARLKFGSIIPPYVREGTDFKLKIMIVDEIGSFYETAIEGLRVSVEFQFFQESNLLDDENEKLGCLVKFRLGEAFRWIRIQIPEGKFLSDKKFRVNMQEEIPHQKVRLLPARSSFIRVIPKNTMPPADVMPEHNFYVERWLDGPCGTIIIKEEFGASIGSHLWDSSIVLAQYLMDAVQKQTLNFSGKTVLELGCGLGLPGICAATLGAQVTLTDKGCLMELVCANCAINNVFPTVMELCWEGSDPDLGVFDFIIAADVLYNKDVLPPLVRILKLLSTKNTIILLAQKKRDSTTSSRKRAVTQNELFLPLIEGYFIVQPILDFADVEIVQLKTL